MKFQVYQRQQHLYTGDLEETVELGRQKERAERPFVPVRKGSGWRVPIAIITETNISREQLRLDPAGPDFVRITNLSGANPVQLGDGSVMAASASYEVALPALVSLGDFAIRIEPAEEVEEDTDLQSLVAPTLIPGRDLGSGSKLSSLVFSDLVEKDTEGLILWLQTVTGVLQSAASTNDFFQRAAQGVVDLVGLDSGRVLLCEGPGWNVVAEKLSVRPGGHGREWRPSNQVLGKVRHEKRTFWTTPGKMNVAASLVGVESVVAAPILDSRGEVIGVLYGDRLQNAGAAESPGVTKLEAMLVETLAGGVATGLARITHEKAALAAEVKFEQFFSRELSQRLTAEPDLLAGRDAQVTLIFCDIRAFSRVSERLGPRETFEWIGDVMSVLTDCVSAHGVGSVDYMGDELIAMWGAPDERPDQAQLAARAAIDIIRALPALGARWQAKIGESIRVGIGINTGLARVGNTGSARKFKYGPLGGTVNLASRAQGATKYLRSDIVMTAATQKLLDPSFATRRLCKVRVVNIAEPVDLYELRTEVDGAWETLKRGYEEALSDFEQRNFRQATSKLGRILADYPDDSASLVLLSRALNNFVNKPTDFDPAWELPGK